MTQVIKGVSGVPAIIIGNGVTALGTLRALHRKKVDVYLDCQKNDEARLSRWYRHLTFLTKDRSQIDYSALAALPFERMVLIPCSDQFVMQLTKIPEEYKSRFLISSCSSAALATFVDKAKFTKLIKDTGINAPVTEIVNSREDLLLLPKAAFDNAFLKPVNSQRFLKQFGVKAMRVNSLNEALETFKRIDDSNFRVVLQKYIPGPSSNHYFVDGFCDRHGEIKALLARRRLRIYPVDFGNSCFMRTVPKEEVESAIEDIKVIMKSVNYRGIFSVEFKLDEFDGKLKIIEVNARAWWYVGFAADCGVNMPWLAYQDALQQNVQSIDEYPLGEKCVYPYLDFNSYREGLEPKISFREMLSSWIGAKQPVFCWTDPMPGIVLGFRVFKQYLLKKFRFKEHDIK